MSIFVPDLSSGTFDSEVNERWMEALDVGSGRLYFVRLEKNSAGDSVKPQGETSWEPPSGFLVRQQLVHALAKALAKDSDSAFLARVRERFPPPQTAPPPAAADDDVKQLHAQIAQLESEKAALLARAERAEANTPQLPPRPMLASMTSRPGSWKRGASQRFSTIAEQPPEPPAWALAKAVSGVGPYFEGPSDDDPPAVRPPSTLNRKVSGGI